MSSMISAQGVVFATAMAVSGTAILLALRLHRSCFHLHQIEIPTPSPPPILRSCISSDGKKKTKKKRVHFAEDVVDSCRDGQEFRRRQQQQQHGIDSSSSLKSNSKSKIQKNCSGGTKIRLRGMPANRMALYNGILRDRVSQRLAYSH